MTEGATAPQGYSLPSGQQQPPRLTVPGQLPTALTDDDKKSDPFAELPQWAARQSRGGSGAFFLKSEKRDWTNMGRAGGFYERQDGARNDYNSDDEEIDEFGRKKKRKTAKAKPGAKAAKDEKAQKNETKEARPEEVVSAASSTAPPSMACHPLERDGDWMCPFCGDLQFARNAKCRMCGNDRPTGLGKPSTTGYASVGKGVPQKGDAFGKGPASQTDGLTEELRWSLAQMKGCKGALLQAKGASPAMAMGGAPAAMWNDASGWDGWGVPNVGTPGKGGKGIAGMSQEALSSLGAFFQYANAGGLNDGSGW